jgi:ATP-dependent helicase HrpB
VVAPPGSGKTTRVPVALLGRGPLVLLQPRRVATRSLARRIADENGWTVGDEVGYQVRFERVASARTRLLVATEGILTARLVGDPLLSDLKTVVIDEFHERSVNADLALALSRQAFRARDDLALVVMSATLDASRVSAFLGGCPVIAVEGRPHPIDVRYAPGTPPAAAVRETLGAPGGHLLCFLPGAGEIRRVEAELGTPAGVRVLPLHGSLDAASQDAALAPSAQRKVILATNVAETSLTVEGVTDVVDSGLHKLMRYETDSGLDRLSLERIPQDAADQRAGRAGRTGEGRVRRLWDPRDRLRPHREPEIARVDLAGPALDVLAWGGDPRTFEWFEAPPAERVEAALGLLARLGAVAGNRLTPLGDRLRRLPLHPRLARVLVECGGSRRAAAACAVLSERRAGPPAQVATDSDVLALADALHDAAPATRALARELAEIAAKRLPAEARLEGDLEVRRALCLAYSDRIARRREPGSRRVLLASGAGATLGRESGVVEGEFLVAHELSALPGSGEVVIRAASKAEPEWLTPRRKEVRHHFDPASEAVAAVEEERFFDLVVGERRTAPDPEVASRLLVEELERRGPGPEAAALVARARFAGLALDLRGLLQQAVAGATRMPRVDLAALLPFETARALERLAPETLAVPSGRRVPLDYRDDGSVAAAVKLQELFGLAESPRLGPRAEPVLLLLLSPGGRPVQTTRDLRSFWDRTYAEVRKELRGRYPKHPWPEDPWTAPPTARAKPRKR